MKEKEIENIKCIKDLREVFTNLFPIFYEKGNKLNILSFCFYRVNYIENLKNYSPFIKINNDYYESIFFAKNGIFRIKIKNYMYYFNFYKCQISKEKLVNYNPQNLIKFSFKNQTNEIIMPVVYNLIHYKRYSGLTSKVFNINDDLVCYFRQAKLNSICLTVRQHNKTDLIENRIKIFWAKVLSFLTLPKNCILLYEKEANKYEESASVVYEKLIDLGKRNCYYIINKDSRHISFIKEKYKKNIIYAHTFKHYYYFFKCHKFIGTETVPHSIELRVANKFVARKFIKKNYKQVFLQHGVMYMIALDSKTRSGFRKNGNEMPKDAKIVVSSKKERNHFIELGGFSKEDLYVTGLPFYDRTTRKDNANKIVIMPTWRSWDYNVLISNYKEASYYKFCKKIIQSIPRKYKKNVILLPHPLIIDKLKRTDLSSWIPDVLSYDKILEDTELLITDYSSIAYSAFYRGAKIIFCWDELEKCMEKYNSHLMLNEKNCFGDITYNCKNLSNLIEKNYFIPQKDEYIKRYREIVEFHDNKNTERLIECLKKDNII